MKSIAITLFSAFILTGMLQAGNNSDKTPDNDESTKTSQQLLAIEHLVSFTATPREGTTYLNWKVQGEQNNCAYVVERSQDGVNYEIIDFKEGFEAPSHLTLLYSWKETAPEGVRECWYRVQRVDFENPVRYSKPVYVLYPDVPANTDMMARTKPIGAAK